MDDLQITESQSETVTILNLVGKIRIGDGSVKLRAALRVIVGDGKKQILLNLAEVSHIDSSGLGELVAGFTSLKDLGGNLKLVYPNQRIRELMIMTKLSTVFDLYESELEAVNSFQIPCENVETKQSEVINEKLDEALATA